MRVCSHPPRPFLFLKIFPTPTPRQQDVNRALCVCGKEHHAVVFLPLLLAPSLSQRLLA